MSHGKTLILLLNLTVLQVDKDSVGVHLIAPKGGLIYSMGSIDVKEYYGGRNKYAICKYSTSN